MVLVETLGDILVKELAGIVKFPDHRALVPNYWSNLPDNRRPVFVYSKVRAWS